MPACRSLLGLGLKSAAGTLIPSGAAGVGAARAAGAAAGVYALFGLQALRSILTAPKVSASWFVCSAGLQIVVSSIPRAHARATHGILHVTGGALCIQCCPNPAHSPQLAAPIQLHNSVHSSALSGCGKMLVSLTRPCQRADVCAESAPSTQPQHPLLTQPQHLLHHRSPGTPVVDHPFASPLPLAVCFPFHAIETLDSGILHLPSHRPSACPLKSPSMCQQYIHNRSQPVHKLNIPNWAKGMLPPAPPLPPMPCPLLFCAP